MAENLEDKLWRCNAEQNIISYSDTDAAHVCMW